MLLSWLRRGYPTANVEWSVHTLNWPTANPPWTLPDSSAGCGEVNNALATQRTLDGSPPRWRYYGLVIDTAGFMRGCAAGIPAYIASGPTGTGNWGWDFDGSYGDWYGAHELGHTYGRGHANFCGAEGGPSYPFPAAASAGRPTTRSATTAGTWSCARSIPGIGPT